MLYEQIESNALITGYTDVTPFLAYFCENVYGRLQFGTDASHADMQLYKDALEAGTVTEKERQLWEYVLSAYGTEEFTTKRLEKDFGNAAYATIRAFVMKFASMGLLKQEKPGTKFFIEQFKAKAPHNSKAPKAASKLFSGNHAVLFYMK